MLDPDVRRVLDGTSIAHLATVLPDGSPHTTPVYVGAYSVRRFHSRELTALCLAAPFALGCKDCGHE